MTKEKSELIIGILTFILLTILNTLLISYILGDFFLRFQKLRKKYRSAKALVYWNGIESLITQNTEINSIQKKKSLSPEEFEELEGYIREMCFQAGWILFFLMSWSIFEYLFYLMCFKYCPL